MTFQPLGDVARHALRRTWVSALAKTLAANPALDLDNYSACFAFGLAHRYAPVFLNLYLEDAINTERARRQVLAERPLCAITVCAVALVVSATMLASKALAAGSL